MSRQRQRNRQLSDEVSEGIVSAVSFLEGRKRPVSFDAIRDATGIAKDRLRYIMLKLISAESHEFLNPAFVRQVPNLLEMRKNNYVLIDGYNLERVCEILEIDLEEAV